MKTKSTFWLLLITLLVAGGYYFAKRKLPTTEETAERQKRVLDFKAADVTRMEIKGADRDFLFERREGKWFFARPLQVRADAGEIEGILSGLEFLESRRRISERAYTEAKLTLSDYGLEKPRASVLFRTPRAESTLFLGNEARQGDALYVQVKGEKAVHLVDKFLATRLEKKIEDYRERNLFDFRAEKIALLNLRAGDKHIEISRTNQLWRIVQPLSARADRDKVEDFLRRLAALRADDFLSEDPAASREYGLEEPAEEISVRLEKEEAVHTLVFGSKLKTDDKKIAARVKGQNSIVAVAAAFAAEAARALNDFRDRNLAPFASGDAREIEMRHRGATLLLQKPQNDWQIVQPEKLAADSELVEKLLTRLSGMQIKEFAADVLTDLDKFGLKTPSARVTIRARVADSAAANAGTNAPPAAVAPPILDLEIGKTDSGKKLTYVKRADESSIYAVDAADAAALPKGAFELRSRVLFAIAKDAIQAVSVKKGRSAVGVAKTPEGKWKLDESASGVLNETAWQRLLNRLQRFEVSKIQGVALNTYAKQRGFDPPAATISVTGEFDGKKGVQEIVVGREAGGVHAIVWKNQLLIAEITREDFQTLTAELLVKPPSAPSRAASPSHAPPR